MAARLIHRGMFTGKDRFVLSKRYVAMRMMDVTKERIAPYVITTTSVSTWEKRVRGSGGALTLDDRVAAIAVERDRAGCSTVVVLIGETGRAGLVHVHILVRRHIARERDNLVSDGKAEVLFGKEGKASTGLLLAVGGVPACRGEKALAANGNGFTHRLARGHGEHYLGTRERSEGYLFATEEHAQASKPEGVGRALIRSERVRHAEGVLVGLLIQLGLARSLCHIDEFVVVQHSTRRAL
jgi:hypothetical protein